MPSHRIHAAHLAQPWYQQPRTLYVFMLAPALLTLIGVLYPFALGIYSSLTNEKLYVANTKFIGFGNYVSLFKTVLFQTSLANTVSYSLMAVAIQIPLGLMVALLLDIPTRLRTFFRSSMVLPLLIPPVVAGLMLKTMMQPQSGILNWTLNSLGLPDFPWLTDVSTALFSVVVIDTWSFMPFAAIIFLAGLQSVPTDIVEAAKMDGANAWKIFERIQLPWLVPYILLVAMFRVADSLKSFELIYATTRGGPLDATRTIHIMAYEEAYRWSNFGRSMAAILILWLLSYLVCGVLLVLWYRYSENHNDE